MDIETRNKLKHSPGGFTIVELIVVFAMMAILLAIATPPFLQWQQNLQYKQAADGIVTALRTARNNAISLNRQNRVEFQPSTASYRTTQGDRTYDSNNWTTVKQDWVAVPTGVVMTNCVDTTNVNIQFNPNGTASAGNICIRDNTSPKYQISVAASGRITSVRQ